VRLGDPPIECERKGVKILEVCTAPLLAEEFVDMLSIDKDDERLPAFPEYDYFDALAEVAKQLGKKYIIYFDEDGGGVYDEVVFTNREELVEEARRLARVLRELVSRYMEEGKDPWKYAGEIWKELEKAVA